MLEAAGRAVRQAVGRLKRSPGFTLAAVVTLGLGIGANTAIFSVVDAVMLKPLPYPAANRLVAFGVRDRGEVQPDFSIPQFQFLRAHARAAADLAGYRGVGIIEVSHGGAVSWARGLEVTDGFFRVLATPMWRGRTIEAADTQPGAMPAVVLSYGFWRTSFGARAGVLGKQITLNGKPAVVAGIAPKGFTFQEEPSDFYLALPFVRDLGNQGANTAVIGRLRPGVSLAQARAAIAVLSHSMRRLLSHAQAVTVSSYQALQASSMSAALWLLLGAVELLLLIACANVASLVLARALARRPEIILRRALGARTGDLFLQFLADGLVLAGLGAAAGLALAELSIRALAVQLPWDIPLAGQIGLDWRVLSFALASGLGVSVIFSLASLSQARGQAMTPGRYEKPSRTRNGIVVGEVALTLVLLVGAGLLVQSLRNLTRQPLGFSPQGRVIFETQLARHPVERFPGFSMTQLPPPPAPSAATAWRFEQEVIRAIGSRPGTEIAATDMPPLAGQSNLPSQRADRPRESASVELRAVSPAFFQTLGIPLLAGRTFSAADNGGAPLVAVVDGKLAQRWFGGGAVALGGQVRLGAYGDKIYSPAIAQPRIIVGIVGEVKTQAVGEPVRTTIYVPAAQLGNSDTWWVVRGGGWTERELRQTVRQINPEVRISSMEPYPVLIAHTLARPSFEAWLMSAFALLALALTAVGLYGLLAYAVTRQTREIGIRIALGAKPGRVIADVAGRGLTLAGLGIVVGLAAAIPLSKLMAGLLYGVPPVNGVALAGAAGMLAAVALVACTLPALRAARVDPAIVLRQE